MDGFIEKSIEIFCKYTDEFKVDISGKYHIKILNDIYEFVLADDEFYSKRMIHQKDSLYGLFYVTKNEELLLLLKTADIENMLVTACHEIVHIYDFIKLEEKRNIHNYRKLQEDVFFLLWSEFHADYLAYKYFINLNKDTINPLYVTRKLLDELDDYYNSAQTLDVQTAVDITVRLYGRYMALQSAFSSDLKKHIKHFYYDQSFLNIYDFLWEHRNFDLIINDMDKWVNILKSLENE